MDFIAGAELSLSRGYVEGAWSVYDTNDDGVLDRCENGPFARSRYLCNTMICQDRLGTHMGRRGQVPKRPFDSVS